MTNETRQLVQHCYKLLTPVEQWLDENPTVQPAMRYRVEAVMTALNTFAVENGIDVSTIQTGVTNDHD